MRQETETRPLDDFERAYRARIEQAGPVMRLTAALVRLTGFGERPAALDRAATALGWSTEETLALLRQWDSAIHFRDGLVHFETRPPDPGSGRQPRVVRMGERVIDAGGTLAAAVSGGP